VLLKDKEIKVENLKTKIHDQEYSNILKGEYSLTEIITEKSLMAKYGVSKAPVREALTQLCSENMLTSIPRCGYQLTQISMNELQETLELRAILEIGAFDLYKNKISQENIEKLKEHVQIAHQLAKDEEVSKHWFHNMNFHVLLSSFAKNKAITDSLQATLNKCSRYAYQYFHQNWDAHIITDGSSHLDLIKLIENGELELARANLKDDIMAFNDIFTRKNF
jgi:DNA-binding GntR family transcriptional regulator